MIEERKQLTGIRGVAAVFVVLYHCFHHETGIQIIKNGYLSVDLFFILSGFIMSMNYFSRFSNGNVKLVYIKFLINRLARVWPAYIFWLFVNIIYLMWKGRLSYVDIIPNILMVQSFGISPSIIGTGWSISIEFLSYLLFPVMFLLINRLGAVFLLTLMLMSFLLIWYISSLSSPLSSSGPLDITGYNDPRTIIRGLSEFFIGFTMYNFFCCRYKLKLSSYVLDFSFIVLVFLLSFKGTDIFDVFLFSIIILGLFSTRKSILSILLSSKPFYFMGEISYSLYLCHLPLIYFLMDKIKLNVIVSFSISMVILIVISTISYNYIEKPLRLYIKGKF